MLTTSESSMVSEEYESNLDTNTGMAKDLEVVDSLPVNLAAIILHLTMCVSSTSLLALPWQVYTGNLHSNESKCSPQHP